ncbi:hypothetical protein ACFLRN_01590 [Thermoproteota archaeon]
MSRIKMPLIRKIINVGKTSKAVIVPRSWIRHIENETGQLVNKVRMEVNSNLIISPVLKEERALNICSKSE